MTQELTTQEIEMIKAVSRGDKIERDSTFHGLVRRGYLDILNNDIYLTQRGMKELAKIANDVFSATGDKLAAIVAAMSDDDLEVAQYLVLPEAMEKACADELARRIKAKQVTS